MSTQRNRPGTAEGTEATVVRESQSTANSPVRHYPNVPPINQLISDEVELFFRADQTRYTPEQVESKLLHAINTRILTENAQGGLKGRWPIARSRSSHRSSSPRASWSGTTLIWV